MRKLLEQVLNEKHESMIIFNPNLGNDKIIFLINFMVFSKNIPFPYLLSSYMSRQLRKRHS